MEQCSIIECLKTKTKEILANHKNYLHRQSSEPEKTHWNKQVQRMQSAGKCVQMIYERVWFYFWLDEKVAWIFQPLIGVYLGLKTCEDFLCFVAIVRVRVYCVDFLFSLFHVTGELYRFLHWGWANNWLSIFLYCKTKANVSYFWHSSACD